MNKYLAGVLAILLLSGCKSESPYYVNKPVTIPATPNPRASFSPIAPDPAIGALLAKIDGNVKLEAVYQKLLDSAEPKCTEDRQKIGDMTVKSVELAKQQGIQTSNFDMLNGLAIRLREVDKPTSCSQMYAYLLTIMKADSRN